MSMRAGILFGVAAVVAVAMVGVMSFFEKSSVLVTEVEVECLGVNFGLMEGDNLYLGQAFVAVVVEMQVDELKLEEGVIVRPV